MSISILSFSVVFKKQAFSKLGFEFDAGFIAAWFSCAKFQCCLLFLIAVSYRFTAIS
jgi:hypothetical protein